MESLNIFIVSHLNAKIVEHLLNQLKRYDRFISKIYILLNVPENLSLEINNDKLVIIHNTKPRGFGSNMNKIFQNSTKSSWNLLLNPDVEFPYSGIDELFFKLLIEKTYNKNQIIGIKAVDEAYERHKSFRNDLFVLRCPFWISKPKQIDFDTMKVDWVPGYFILVSSHAFNLLNGFDERFFMYLEDADFCRRARKKGLSIIYDGRYRIKHNSQRKSRKNLQHLKWHIESYLKYFLIYGFKIR